MAPSNPDAPCPLQALVQNGRIPLSVIQKAIEARNGRLVTALVWRAKFSMRTAVMVQRDIAKVPPRMMLHAARLVLPGLLDVSAPDPFDGLLVLPAARD